MANEILNHKATLAGLDREWRRLQYPGIGPKTPVPDLLQKVGAPTGRGGRRRPCQCEQCSALLAEIRKYEQEG